VIYLDSAALLKLLHEERESLALEQWISARAGTPAVSSVLARVDLIPLTSDLVDEAAEAAEPLLRSLAAIHLVSALSIRAELSAFVAYDSRLAEAGAAAGLDPVRPGT